MGSDLIPTLANAFMCHYEKEWLDNCPILFKPTIYKRYVDDIFVQLFVCRLDEKTALMFEIYI